MTAQTLFLLQEGGFGDFWSLVIHTGPIGQAVLLVLLLFSLFSWAIILRKARFYGEVDRQSEAFHEQFQASNSLSEIYRQCDRFPQSPLAGIFKSVYEELNYRIRSAQSGSNPESLPEDEVVRRSMNSLQRTLQRASMAEMIMLERSLSWLATTGAVTPFIGLFGTVVGIINAFQGLGAGGPTTIQAVAPGISEALVATAAGLFAAIPAVIAYNQFINRLRRFGAQMDEFSAELLNLIERSFV